MKLTLLIAIIGISSAYGYLADEDYGAEFLALTKLTHKKCVPITGVTQELIDAMKNGNFPDNEILKRYTLCLWLVAEAMTTDFNINTKMVEKSMPKKIVNGKELLQSCGKQAQKSGLTSPHETVYEVMKCFYKADPEHFIMF